MPIKLSDEFTYKKIIKFTLPAILMQVIVAIYGTIDGLFLSNYTDEDQFAAVNIAWPVIRIILSILGEIIIKPIFVLMGAKDNILRHAVINGRISFIGVTANILQNTFQCFTVTAGKPKIGFIIMLCAGITNVVSDYILIYKLNKGNVGSAVSGCFAQFVGGFLPLIYFSFKNSTDLYLGKTKFKIKPILKACFNGISELISYLSISFVNILYNYRLLKISGSDGVNAHGIISFFSLSFISIFLGFANGSIPIISYRYGAKNIKGIKSVLKKSLIIVTITSVIIFLLTEGFSSLLTRIFINEDNNLYKITLLAIRIYSISFALMGFNIYGSAFFTGLSNSILSAIISCCRSLLFEIIMIYTLPELFGLNGIWMAPSVAEGITLIITLIIFFFSNKKYNYF
ncbi:hypothetical protein BCR36DRAFT_409697 [Piromyces finnis]|uniref:Mate-domain-containing protein n=1 Tax=Piromyces finnis TaxID=1754191 RepID=A0A1Y1VHJ2_9FUNG|nr:hypothetical protein BCR36DRAFT_409697 [Piromyces finnis]|eukprot:ORX56500.1 hypothetical protein BCR36DRAFT_409697 [Piromyces finnis]